MSVRTIETRLCDVCETEYSESLPAWMIMTAVNAPAEAGGVFDFCTFECLSTWVNEDDDEVATSTDNELTDGTSGTDEDVETRPAPPEVTAGPVKLRPAMTLADSIMMGQKPGFDPLRDAPQSDSRGR
jgi:hypothetical protein